MKQPIDHNIARVNAAADAWHILATRLDLTDDELTTLFAQAAPIFDDPTLLREMLSEMPT